MKKFLLIVLTLAMLVSVLSVSGLACTMIYVGSDLTEDGATYYGRSEDYLNCANKLFIVSEAGTYEGTYIGCRAYGGGFTMELDHPSYRFTAFTADMSDGICPECYEEADHLSYSEAGTNEKGVTVSATETLFGLDDVLAVDPYHDGEDPALPVGIEETDIPTVILSEAATAREGVELLLSIYDEYGCQDASGLIIADQSEMWYIENCSGTQYIAILMTPDMIVLEPNMAVIGAVDLDDTDNVIASSALIETAQAAGTFVGDADENIINFRASYTDNSIDDRLVNGLNYVNADGNYTAEMLEADNSLFTISNLDENGEIVPLYTNITADRTFGIDDMVGYYHIDGIGRNRNEDTTIFTISAEGDAETATVEWVAMDDCQYNVFVPYYPMLTEDTYIGYQAGTGVDGAEFTDEEPADDSVMYCSGSTWMEDEETGEWAPVDGYYVFPDGWEDSFYWSFDALSNYILTRDDSQQEYVQSSLNDLQNDIYVTFAEMQSVLAENPDACYATVTSNAMSAQAHALALQLFSEITSDAGTASNG